MEKLDPLEIYPLATWKADCDWFHQASSKYLPNSASMEMEEFHGHFCSTRKDPFVARYCLDRFVAAMKYLDKNADSICQGELGVTGSNGVDLVSVAVFITLYRFFVARPDCHLDTPIPLDVFLKEALGELSHL